MTTFGKPGPFDPVNLRLTPTAETPGGGGLTDDLEQWFAENLTWDAFQRMSDRDLAEAVADVVAAAAVQARAEVVARVEAACDELERLADGNEAARGTATKVAAYYRRCSHKVRAALAGPNPRGGQDGGGE